MYVWMFVRNNGGDGTFAAAGECDVDKTQELFMLHTANVFVVVFGGGGGRRTVSVFFFSFRSWFSCTFVLHTFFVLASVYRGHIYVISVLDCWATATVRIVLLEKWTCLCIFPGIILSKDMKNESICILVVLIRFVKNNILFFRSSMRTLFSFRLITLMISLFLSMDGDAGKKLKKTTTHKSIDGLTCCTTENLICSKHFHSPNFVNSWLRFYWINSNIAYCILHCINRNEINIGSGNWTNRYCPQPFNMECFHTSTHRISIELDHGIVMKRSSPISGRCRRLLRHRWALAWC